MIFLDHAATSFQKPPSVPLAVQQAMRTAASPGRGSYGAALRAAEIAFRCRERAAALFEVSDPERVVLTSSATHGLNIAIRSLVKPGSRVLVTGYEHNAVTRTLEGIGGVKIRIAEGSLFQPDELLTSWKRLLPSVDAAVCCHVSNVFGYILPLEEMAAACHGHHVPLIVDAAQSAGTVPIHIDSLGAAYLAMPGHKGLFGPQGTGLLLCGKDVKPEPLVFGGTGSASLLQEMPDFLPDRLEAGTQNIPGFAGLYAGMGYVMEQGTQRILRHEQTLCAHCARRLSALPKVQVYASQRPELQTGVLSFVISGLDVEEAGERLGAQGIAVRCGFHCAPYAHRSAGTLETGTIRAGFSPFNTLKEGEALTKAVTALL